ncbi:MAG: monovalent cation/H(+) antiporter subunit G [Gammaproteobacteria bacterium]
MIADLLSWMLIAAGSFFCLVGATGLIRMPDFFTRVHGAGVLDTLGVAGIVAGLGIQAGLSLVLIKLVLILALLWITGPTAAHALARAAVHGGLNPDSLRAREGDS